jgi:hypothetical protein
MRTKTTSKALEVLKQMHHNRSKLPSYAVPPYKHRPTTAKGLQKCIRDYINYTGHHCEMRDNTGMYKGGSQFTDVLGRTRIIQGRWVKGGGTKGTADLSAIKKVKINGEVVGRMVAIEVKHNDRQSTAQKIYEGLVKDAGGVYMIAQVGQFDEWVKQWEAI